MVKDAAFAVANLLLLGEMRSFWIFLGKSRKKTDANLKRVLSEERTSLYRMWWKKQIAH